MAPVEAMAVVDDVEAAAGAAHRALDALGVALADEPIQCEAVLRAAEHISRRVEALIVQAMAAARRSHAPEAHGHRSLAAWCRATARWSPAESADRVRTERLARDVPEVVAALDSGDAPVASVRMLARAAANVRCRQQMTGLAPQLLREAGSMPVDEFGRLARRLEQYLDADGAHRSAESAHCGRSAWIATVGDEVHVRARFGIAQGALLREVLDRYTDAELRVDATRTAAQRRADALHAIFLSAAGGTSSRVPTVNVVVDQATLEAATAELLSGQPCPRAGDASSYRCETIDGDPLTPFDVAAAAVVGYVRRVVFSLDGVVVDMSRRSRLFRGAAREAVWLAHRRHCVHPGCGARSYDVDHQRPWCRGGSTNPANGVPLCGYHNRWKHEHGYRVWRDPTGAWHTTLPDGSELPRPA